jgi:hypothetical protein
MDPYYEFSLTGKSWNGTTDFGDTSPISALDLSSPRSETQLSIDDVVTENYKKRVARGEIINNPMTKRSTHVTYPALSTYISRQISKDTLGRYTGYEWVSEHCFPNSWLGSNLSPEFDESYSSQVNNAINRAVQQAHAKCSSDEFAAYMVAAEGRKTVQSMAEILGRVAKILRAVKRLDLKYLKKQITKKELAARYMELRYALRPLAIDFEQAAKASVAMDSYKHVRATARGYEELKSSSSDVIYNVEAGGLKFDIHRSVDSSVVIRSGVLCDLTTSSISVLGLDQPIEAIWEVIPFSFILDWFFNIADTISAWTPNHGIRELASWVTVETTNTYRNSSGNISRVSPTNYLDYIYFAGSRTTVDVIKTRTVNPQLSIWPTSRVNLDTFKLLDLAIIAKGLWSSLKR